MLLKGNQNPVPQCMIRGRVWRIYLDQAVVDFFKDKRMQRRAKA
jgi:hypothetical protein